MCPYSSFEELRDSLIGSDMVRSKCFIYLFIFFFFWGGGRRGANLTKKKVQVGKDQEKAQSERDSHSKNRGGNKPN